MVFRLDKIEDQVGTSVYFLWYIFILKPFPAFWKGIESLPFTQIASMESTIFVAHNTNGFIVDMVIS
jgi:hypothetical protein